MEKLYFTKKGLEKILNQKAELFKKLREVQSKKGEAHSTASFGICFFFAGISLK